MSSNNGQREPRWFPTIGKGKSYKWQIREIRDSKANEKGQNYQMKPIVKSTLRGSKGDGKFKKYELKKHAIDNPIFKCLSHIDYWKICIVANLFSVMLLLSIILWRKQGSAGWLISPRIWEAGGSNPTKVTCPSFFLETETKHVSPAWRTKGQGLWVGISPTALDIWIREWRWSISAFNNLFIG